MENIIAVRKLKHLHSTITYKHLHEFYYYTETSGRISFHILCTFVEAIKSLLFYPNRSHLKYKMHINVPLIGCFAS